MALTSPIRLQFLVATTAEFATDDFNKRAGFNTSLDAWRIKVAGVERVTAMRDAAQTFQGLQTFAAGVRVSTLTNGQVLRADVGGAISGDAGFTHTTSGGITRAVSIGDYAVPADVIFAARQTAGQIAGLAINDSAQNRRWTVSISTGTNFRVGRWTNSGTKVDDPIDIVAGSAGLITIGGNSNSATNFTGAIQTSGVQRISAGGAGSLTTLSTTGLATLAQATVSDLPTGCMVSTTTAGRLQALNAAASRTLIGIGDATGGAITVVKDASVAPPGSPVIGVPYLVGIGATGAWAGQDDKLATWSGAAWSFVSRASLWTMCFNTTSGTLLTNVDGSGNKLVFLPSLVCSGNIQGATVAGSNADFSGVYKTSGTQVVSTRKTGWVAATGTATRSTFATGSVTLPQLAERVKALIDDLIAHGLIGT